MTGAKDTRAINEFISLLKASHIALHNSQGRIEYSQQKIEALVRSQNSQHILLSPRDLAEGDRYELEARCRAVANPLYLGDHTALCRVFGICKIYVDTRDTGFSSHVLLDGHWEMWLTIFFVRHIKPGMRVIDIGANFGYYTLLFGMLVGPEGHVHAVEPNPIVLPKLRRSVSLNGLASRTTILEAAAGAEDRDGIELYVPHGELKNGTICNLPGAMSPELGVCHRVRQITVDSAISATPVDFVKIDAEGAEEAVIAGMNNIILRDKPKLLVEFNAARCSDPAALLNRLRALYEKMQYIDLDGVSVDATSDKILQDGSGEDWLLYFHNP